MPVMPDEVLELEELEVELDEPELEELVFPLELVELEEVELLDEPEEVVRVPVAGSPLQPVVTIRKPMQQSKSQARIKRPKIH